MAAAEADGATLRFRSEVVGVHSVDGVVSSTRARTVAITITIRWWWSAPEPVSIGSFSRLRTPQNTTNSVLG